MLIQNYKKHGRLYAFTFNMFLDEEPEFRRIFEEIHRESIDQYIKEFQPAGEQLKTMDYISECIDAYDYDNYVEILEAYAKEKGWKCCIYEAYMESDLLFYSIIQVVPQTKEDLQEMVEGYLEHNGMPANMAELIVDKIARKG